ncbi:MAG TPA: hypothetical protein VD840_09120, partial [Sinorhizobium sp.]|nr:hypothetical protein [Sinorhizobium sp.]
MLQSATDITAPRVLSDAQRSLEHFDLLHVLKIEVDLRRHAVGPEPNGRLPHLRWWADCWQFLVEIFSFTAF